MSDKKLNPSTWVDKYSNYLFNYAITRVNDEVVAKDLISETYLAGLKSKENFKGNSTERTWLVLILKHKIIDHYRKINSKKGKAEVKIDYTSEDQEGDWLEERVADHSDQSAEDDIENTELGLAIENCLENINEKQAQIFRMKTIQEYDTEAICNVFDISPSNLWMIIHRARKSLADCMDSSWLKN
ncbi:sigma-70 family RNA polymerase sigma factor [Mesohalobacter halotolerans]|uniref:Sigma-70 family RNA polymerase sigma factor n=1 Tax=Mesohalobacter halotolerans TaxID=1883405 RepID=A0A4U5TSQ7_9FLAO|nr:sigma-70 family RNA polymerase sigma factor [Mesohalobacter halotolerans]TKS57367.1 sigma-70 family RNA polymerase sigma factor [Mesohalobacter halotolerans]